MPPLVAPYIASPMSSLRFGVAVTRHEHLVGRANEVLLLLAGALLLGGPLGLGVGAR